ncbi:hypothetical protein D3C87_1936590 [compost metagenome]
MMKDEPERLLCRRGEHYYSLLSYEVKQALFPQVASPSTKRNARSLRYQNQVRQANFQSLKTVRAWYAGVVTIAAITLKGCEQGCNWTT